MPPEERIMVILLDTNENQIRNMINRMGYKLKFGGNRYYIKGYPNGLSFKTLEEVSEWIQTKQNKEKEMREEQEKKMKLINDTISFPIYTDSCKQFALKTIGEQEINDSKDYLDKLFDKNSELYEADKQGGVINTYDIEEILSNINYKEHSNIDDYSLEAVVMHNMADFYLEEIKRLNPDIDEDIIFDLPDYDPMAFYYEVIKHITLDELRENIIL